MSSITTGSIQRLFRNRDGAAAVEFAIVSIPLFALIIAIMQTGIVFFADQALQTTTVQSARKLMTGNAQLSSMTQAQFKTNVVCPNAPIFTCSGLMVDVQSASSFTSLNTTTLVPTYSGNNVTNTWSYSPGNPGDIVILRIMYDQPVIGGPLGFSLANQSNGTYLLVGTAVFKNEPYS